MSRILLIEERGVSWEVEQGQSEGGICVHTCEHDERAALIMWEKAPSLVR